VKLGDVVWPSGCTGVDSFCGCRETFNRVSHASQKLLDRAVDDSLQRPFVGERHREVKLAPDASRYSVASLFGRFRPWWTSRPT
jgi:hypothetical protein